MGTKRNITGTIRFKTITVSKHDSVVKVERIILPKSAKAMLITGVDHLPSAQHKTNEIRTYSSHS